MTSMLLSDRIGEAVWGAASADISTRGLLMLGADAQAAAHYTMTQAPAALLRQGPCPGRAPFPQPGACDTTPPMGGAGFSYAVVGAGPAGASCALSLLKSGASGVALIDKARFPRDKACGDG